MFNVFRRKGLIDTGDLYFPDEEFNWAEPWWGLEQDLELRMGLQVELHKELSSKHPLWGLEPVVFGKCGANDDIVVHLNDGRFACVHLVWHGKVDQFPKSFPSVAFYENTTELQEFLNNETQDYT